MPELGWDPFQGNAYNTHPTMLTESEIAQTVGILHFSCSATAQKTGNIPGMQFLFFFRSHSSAPTGDQHGQHGFNFLCFSNEIDLCCETGGGFSSGHSAVSAQTLVVMSDTTSTPD